MSSMDSIVRRVSGLFHRVEDTAQDAVSDLRISLAVKEEKNRIQELFRETGVLLYATYEKTGECPDAVRELFRQIDERKEVIASLEKDADTVRVHTRPADAPDSEMSVGTVRRCPDCGTAYVEGARACAHCGHVFHE